MPILIFEAGTKKNLHHKQEEGHQPTKGDEQMGILVRNFKLVQLYLPMYNKVRVRCRWHMENNLQVLLFGQVLMVGPGILGQVLKL